MPTTLVVGATGFLGSAVCQRLAADGRSVRALVRPSSNPDKVNRLESMGAEIARGDVRDRASLDRACGGADAVVSTVASMPFSYIPGENDITSVDHDGEISLIEAAKGAGVRHFVYTSFSGNLDIDFPLRNAKRAVERYLAGSGLYYTILRPSCFMEVWLGPAVGFDAPNARATIYGSGTNPISWISLQDVADFAVASLDNPAARNAVLELGGPETISPLDVVGIFERVAGRTFQLQHVPVEAIEAQQAAASDPMHQSFNALMRCVAAGDPIDMRGTLKAFPVRLTSVEEYARRVLAPA